MKTPATIGFRLGPTFTGELVARAERFGLMRHATRSATRREPLACQRGDPPRLRQERSSETAAARRIRVRQAKGRTAAQGRMKNESALSGQKAAGKIRLPSP